MTQFEDIKDNEIRIIGASSSQPDSTKESTDKGHENKHGKNRKKKIFVFLAILAVVIIAILALVLFIFSADRKEERPRTEVNVADDYYDEYANEAVNYDDFEEDVEATVIMSEDSINDLELQIFTPEGCTPELYVGPIDTLDKSIVLCAQAADIRGDNGEIVSAFILDGEPLSRGIAKRGFCAIIDNEITLGMAEETPMYERVVEKGGDFFRQYPLVHDSKMQKNKPKGKSIRKALCIKDGKICIIKSKERESFHDFAQALQDYGVTEAIALTGSDATLFCTTPDGQFHNFGLINNDIPKLNYIVFRK